MKKIDINFIHLNRNEVVPVLIGLSSLLIILSTIFTNIEQGCETKRSEELFYQQHLNNGQQTAVGAVLNAGSLGKDVDAISKWIFSSAEDSRLKIREILENNKCNEYSLMSQIFLIVSFILNGSVIYLSLRRHW